MYGPNYNSLSRHYDFEKQQMETDEKKGLKPTELDHIRNITEWVCWYKVEVLGRTRWGVCVGGGLLSARTRRLLSI